MYLNRNIFLFAAVSCSVNLESAEAGSCTQSDVNAASNAGFLEYALLNCVGRGQAFLSDRTTTVLGRNVLDPQTCAASFASVLGNGECLGEYVAFVSRLQSQSVNKVSPFDPDNSYDGCKYESSKGLTMSYVCWNRLQDNFLQFYRNTGRNIFSDACDGSTVREQALADIFGTTIKKTVRAKLGIGSLGPAEYKVVDYSIPPGTPRPDGSAHVAVGMWAKSDSGAYKSTGVDLRLGMCYGAYQTILDILQGDSRGVLRDIMKSWGVQPIGATGSGPINGWLDSVSSAPLTLVMDACKDDPSSSGCADSLVVSGLRQLFTDLSGYDIGFVGPLCDAGVISKSVDMAGVSPTPYQFFVMCGLLRSQNSKLCSKQAVDDYVSKLQDAVGSECIGCYNEMSLAIENFLNDSTATGACNSYANITSRECVAALSPIAVTFSECSGADLYTSLPMSQSTDSNTTSYDTAANAANPSNIPINSLVVVVASIAAYLM